MRDHRAEVSLHIAPDERYEATPVDPREFRILVLGDFSARGDSAPLTADLPRRVDRDDLDAHVARIAPRLRIEIDGAELGLAFASMDDFHPDRLVARLAALERRVTSPVSPERPAPDRERAPAPAPDIARAVSGASLLDDMLEDVGPTAPSNEPRPTRPRDELSAFVERAVAPHLVRPPDSQTAARADAKHQETVSVLRQILHHPRVQALEATWRAVELLVRRLDTDGDLRVYLLDVSRTQVAAAIERIAQHRQAASDESWALAISLHAYPDGDEGAELIAHAAMASRVLGTPLVAGAPASLTGAQSALDFDDDERALAPAPDVYRLIRRSLEARFLGLTFPRLLLREPYGAENPCDSIDFTELDDPGRHDDYLWGSGATAVALLVGSGFNERGWGMGGRMALELSSLPLFMYKRGPETVAASCAEMVMSERVARHLLSRGLMPLAWIKNTDRVRLVELRSVAEPTAPLAATWAGSTSGSAQ
jgi:type VI secretion system protein ImpC